MKKHIVVLSVADFAPYAESTYIVSDIRITSFFTENVKEAEEEWKSVCKEIKPLGYFCKSKTKTTYLFVDGTKEELPENSDENQFFLKILNERFSPHF